MILTYLNNDQNKGPGEGSWIGRNRGGRRSREGCPQRWGPGSWSTGRIRRQGRRPFGWGNLPLSAPPASPKAWRRSCFSSNEAPDWKPSRGWGLARQNSVAEQQESTSPKRPEKCLASAAGPNHKPRPPGIPCLPPVNQLPGLSSSPPTSHHLREGA